MVGWAAAQTASVVAVSQINTSVVGSAQPTAAPTIYFTADEMPAFPGGDAALMKFLGSKLNYPAAALERSLFG